MRRMVWVVLEGKYYSESTYVDSLQRTKKGAMKYCRAEGFKWHENREAFYNDEKMLYRKLEKHEVFDGYKLLRGEQEVPSLWPPS